MTRPVERLLAGLPNARPTGPGRWLAACPGPLHRRGDRNRSLSLGETAEGVVLLHCFAGCEPGEILAVLGLDLRDLYPPQLDEPGTPGGRPKVPPIPWRDVFLALETDLTVCQLAFSDLAAGKTFSPGDAAYLAQRAENLATILRRIRQNR
jgi:hypothetical protein